MGRRTGRDDPVTAQARLLTIGDFSGRVGKAVEAQAGGRRVPLVVQAVQELPSAGREGGSFRLEFIGPPDSILGQGTFPFLIGRERFDIFIVPLSHGPEGVRYEAIFY